MISSAFQASCTSILYNSLRPYFRKIRPRASKDDSHAVRHDFNPYQETDFDILIEHWLPLTFALNSLNRSMGHDHAYPFVLAPAAIEKLGFVHRVVREAISID